MILIFFTGCNRKQKLRNHFIFWNNRPFKLKKKFNPYSLSSSFFLILINIRPETDWIQMLKNPNLHMGIVDFRFYENLAQTFFFFLIKNCFTFSWNVIHLNSEMNQESCKPR